MSDTEWTPLRLAWHQALYGPTGFYRREQPSDHFRTSVHASSLFAGAVVELVRRLGLDAVTDLGAGDGQLLTQVARLAPELRLTAIEMRPRPPDLPSSISWCRSEGDLATAAALDALVLANEILDNVACDVVELDAQGVTRVVEVDLESGRERLGGPAGPELLAWLKRWWPLDTPGDRAEVGVARDEAWAAVCARGTGGVSVAVDYGHLAASRPPLGSMTSYRAGRQVRVRFDGRHDVTAHVAVDSVANAVGGRIVRQRDVLTALGVTRRRPPLKQAEAAPADYLRGLQQAGAAAELTATPGLGDFFWILPPCAAHLVERPGTVR